MDLAVIQATKLRYNRKFVREVLVVSETPEDKVNDTRGQRTLDNVRAYNLKSAIFNLSAAWKDITQVTLANAWNSLLHGTEEGTKDFTEFEVGDFQGVFEQAGETGPSAADVEDWLCMDEGDSGYEMLSTSEIAAAVLDNKDEEEEEDDDSLAPFTVTL